jgi:hypothetical protein
MRNMGIIVLESLEQRREGGPARQAAVAASSSPGARRRSSVAGEGVAASPAGGWGWLPALSLVVALGVLLIAVAFTGSRMAASWAEPLFWAGLLTLVMPVAARLAAVAAARQERIGLVVLLGLGLYLVKVMHSPFAFTFPDELVHLRNVDEILRRHHLFFENPSLPVTPLYPGLEIIVAGLAALSGLSPFSVGIIVIGVGRLVLMLALYLLYEQVGGSARVAGIAAVLYMANSNFVFWEAQFSYESLALPLFVLIIFAIARREDAHEGFYRLGLTVVALLVLMTVVMTHHMSSYVLVAFLAAISIFYSLYQRGRLPSTWTLTLIAFVATMGWLLFVASLTIGYLSPVLGGAVSAIFQMIAGEQATTRQLFTSSSAGSAGYVAPLWERLTGIGSVLFILFGLPFGLLQIWRRHRASVFGLVLTGIAVAFLPIQALRFTSAGWETANRASEFLFVGLSFVVAVGIVEFWMRRRQGWGRRSMLAGYVAVVFAGGVLSGWQPNVRLAQPYLVAAGTSIIEPQGVATARWARSVLGPNNRFAVDPSNGKALVAYGEQYPYTGWAHGIRGLLFAAQIGRNEQRILQNTGVRFVALDRRLISWDHMVGLYFNHTGSPAGQKLELLDPEAFAKFDNQQRVSRIFDSGTIVIYYVGALSDGPPIK